VAGTTLRGLIPRGRGRRPGCEGGGGEGGGGEGGSGEDGGGEVGGRVVRMN